jgi:TorA maturation chaperone TorD
VDRPVEVVRALAVLAEPTGPAHGAVAAALGLPEPSPARDHAELFLFQLHPYASVHLGPEGMLGGEARARVAGFWRAVGRTPPAEPDHLSALLGLWASLLDEADDGEPTGADPSASGTLAARAADALLHEHLLPWLLPFLEGVEELGDAHYRAWAALVTSTLLRAREHAATPDGLARHLEMAPPLPDPRVEGASPFLSGVLAPVRSGVVLTRHDLARVARGAGLGVRAGERRYALEHLLGLEPAAVLDGLADLADRAAERYGRWPDTVADVRAFWTERARATGELLRALVLDGPWQEGEEPADAEDGAAVKRDRAG